MRLYQNAGVLQGKSKDGWIKTGRHNWEETVWLAELAVQDTIKKLIIKRAKKLAEKEKVH